MVYIRPVVLPKHLWRWSTTAEGLKTTFRGTRATHSVKGFPDTSSENRPVLACDHIWESICRWRIHRYNKIEGNKHTRALGFNSFDLI